LPAVFLRTSLYCSYILYKVHLVHSKPAQRISKENISLTVDGNWVTDSLDEHFLTIHHSGWLEDSAFDSDNLSIHPHHECLTPDKLAGARLAIIKLCARQGKSSQPWFEVTTQSGSLTCMTRPMGNQISSENIHENIFCFLPTDGTSVVYYGLKSREPEVAAMLSTLKDNPACTPPAPHKP
jgi:hypothetical protein